ncbi:MAG: hypothetical protein J0H85_11545 [Sediminibacterium magnilacihabitans]|jgi:hypothetical protein|nr:hypothetical protein [Sediminibacterium magnilacihabitans]PQV60896.1 hypothetical protein CLV53_105162 [Sediminibacterium magnilacihabitans]
MKSNFPTQACYSQPFRLEKEVLQDPHKVFTCFFGTYTLATAKQYLAEWVELACTTDNVLYIDSEDRTNLLRFCHFMEEMLEAAFIADKQNR